MEFKINFSGTGHKYTKEELNVVLETMQDADPLTQGIYRDKFEKAFCEYNGNDFAFSVCNATAALELAAYLKKMMKLLLRLIPLLPVFILLSKREQKLFGVI